MKEQIYTLEEAKSLVPWLREATEAADQQLRQVAPQFRNSEEARQRGNEIIHHWAETVLKLGGIPKQPFTVDFNSGTDYYCWEYPEEKLCFRHSYQDGYSGRFPIKEES